MVLLVTRVWVWVSYYYSAPVPPSRRRERSPQYSDQTCSLIILISWFLLADIHHTTHSLYSTLLSHKLSNRIVGESNKHPLNVLRTPSLTTPTPTSIGLFYIINLILIFATHSAGTFQPLARLYTCLKNQLCHHRTYLLLDLSPQATTRYNSSPRRRSTVP